MKELSQLAVITVCNRISTHPIPPELTPAVVALPLMPGRPICETVAFVDSSTVAETQVLTELFLIYTPLE